MGACVGNQFTFAIALYLYCCVLEITIAMYTKWLDIIRNSVMCVTSSAGARSQTLDILALMSTLWRSPCTHSDF